jgi:hypothetical protein
MSAGKSVFIFALASALSSDFEVVVAFMLGCGCG